MKEIYFTQYLYPHGIPRRVFVERPDEVAEKAAAVTKAGYEFEADMNPRTMICTFSVADKEKGEDIMMRACINGPDVPNTVDELVNAVHEELSRSGKLDACLQE